MSLTGVPALCGLVGRDVSVLSVLLLIFVGSSLAYLPAVYMQFVGSNIMCMPFYLLAGHIIERDVPWCASAGQTKGIEIEIFKMWNKKNDSVFELVPTAGVSGSVFKPK